MLMHRYIVWGAIILIFVMLIGGCGKPLQVGVQFNNEGQLEQEGYIVNINQEVDIGGEKVIFQKVAFDRNSMAFAYKGGTVPLLADEFIIKGLERTKSQKLTQSDTSPSFGATVGSGYYVIVVPHNLKLVNQKVDIEFHINGKDSKFTIDFPGNIINSTTTEVIVDANGNIVKDTTKASYRVIVGVGYTMLESKDDKDFTVETQDKQKINRSYKGSTTGESLTVYGPLPIPRREPGIEVDTVKKLIIISIK